MHGWKLWKLNVFIECSKVSPQRIYESTNPLRFSLESVLCFYKRAPSTHQERCGSLRHFCCLRRALHRQHRLGASTTPVCRLLPRRAVMPSRRSRFARETMGFHAPSSTPITNTRLRRFSQKAPLTKPVGLGSTDTVKIILTAKEDGKAKRPHQAFVTIKEQETGLEAPFPLTVKDTGKAVVQIVSCSIDGRQDWIVESLELTVRRNTVSEGSPRPIPLVAQAPQGVRGHRLLRRGSRCQHPGLRHRTPDGSQCPGAQVRSARSLRQEA